MLEIYSQQIEHFSPGTVLDFNAFCKRQVRHSPLSCSQKHGDFFTHFSLT